MSKRYCPDGHDTVVCGRDVSGYCRLCNRERMRNRRRDPGARLAESMRDTLRHQRTQVRRSETRAEELYR